LPPPSLSRALRYFSLQMKRIFIAFALALALTGAMVVATVYGRTAKLSAESEIESPS
jgi:hypothetical protein